MFEKDWSTFWEGLEMGASTWQYFAPYSDDIEAVLRHLQGQVLASGDYYWGDDEAPRPRSLGELSDMLDEEENESLLEEGTHSILDIDRVESAASDDGFRTIRALRDVEVDEFFGTRTPTRQQVEAADPEGKLSDFPRWSGRYVTVYDDGRPSGIVVWGCSGD
ncbi:MAG: hypothetical protein ACXVFZ_19860 [Blastococcus sp.]